MVKSPPPPPPHRGIEPALILAPENQEIRPPTGCGAFPLKMVELGTRTESLAGRSMRQVRGPTDLTLFQS